MSSTKISQELLDLDPTALLARLKAVGSESLFTLRDLIILAEVAEFTTEQENELLPILRTFISDNRCSMDAPVITALCSAIRLYVALLPMDEMETVTELLTSKDGIPLCTDAQMEISRMVFNCFTRHDPTSSDPVPRLAERLSVMCEAHSNEWVLDSKGSPCIVINVISALAAMRSPLVDGLVSRIKDVPFVWLHQLIEDSLRKLMADRVEKDLTEQVQEIERLIARLVLPSK